MSSEAISAGIMIIGAVVGAVFLVTSILPTIFAAAGTFGTVAHTADQQMRTDFEIIRAFTPSNSGSGRDPVEVTVWLKNTGQTRFDTREIIASDIFFGNDNGIVRLIHAGDEKPKEMVLFDFVIEGSDPDTWNPGDTLTIKTLRKKSLTPP
jgi:archaellum component FlaG (FlaF/FlaG flagellin family)